MWKNHSNFLLPFPCSASSIPRCIFFPPSEHWCIPLLPYFSFSEKGLDYEEETTKGGGEVAPTSSPDFLKVRAKQGPSFPRQTSSGKKGGSGEIPISLARNRLLWELAVSRRGGEIGLARTRCGGRYNESGESDHGPRPAQ